MAQKKRQLIGCLFFMEAAGRRGKFEGVLPFNQSRCPIGHKKTAEKSAVFFSCPEQDSNLHGLMRPLPPQSSVSTNFTIWAGISSKGIANIHRKFIYPKKIIKFVCYEKTTKMRLKVLFSVLVILVSQMLGAQDFKTLYGKVTDAEDGAPLYLASVNLSGTNISNVTNSEGVFSLKIPVDTRPDAMVRISYMGYERLLAPVSSFDKSSADSPLRIRMTPSVMALDAAKVIDFDADVMFDYAYRSVSLNYPQKYEAMTAFYRELVTKNHSKYLSMNEAVLDISKAPYYASGGDKAGIYKGRGSSNYDSTDSLLVSYKGGVTGSLLLDMVKNPFAGVLLDQIRDAHKYYLFDIGIPASINGKDFRVIEFDQNPAIPYALYRGRIYIDPDSYAIARIEFDLNVEGFPEVLYEYVRKIPKNTRMEMTSASFIMNYKEAEDGLWHYDYSRTEITFTARKRYSPFKTTYSIVSELAVTDHYPGRLTIDSESLMRFGDVMATKLEDFTDPDFWGSYNIIEPDREIDVIIRRIVRQLRRRD